MIWETLGEVENRMRKPLPHNEVCDHLPLNNIHHYPKYYDQKLSNECW